MKRNMTYGSFMAVAALATLGVHAAAPTVLSGGLEVLTATTLSGVTNRYEGLASVIRDNLTLESRTYVRIKGGTSSSHATLKVGPVDSSAANQRPVVTIKGTSGFYGQYRNSNGFLDEADGDQKSSYLDTVIGENGGSALFLVQAIGSGFGGNIRRHGLWLDYVYVSPNATSDGDTIDILQVDAGGDANIMNIEQENDKPARLVFNGGTFTRRYECRRNQSTDNPFKASAGKKLIVSGINGNPINITKLYQTFSLVAGAGTVRFETDGGALRLGSVGGAWGNNFLEWGVPASVDIEWGVKGDIVLYENCWLKLNAENQLPYGPGSGGLVVTSQSASTYAFLDLNGHTARLNSLRMFGQWACVSNKTQSVKGSKIVFGAGDTDGLLNGRVCAGIDIEKVGNGLLVVSNATVEGTMTVKAGRVMFVGANTFATPVVFEDGTTLVRRRDDSTDSVARLSKTGESSVSYTGTPHDICIKQGSDTVNAYAGAYLDGTELSVEEGILRFTGTTSDKWWRLTVRKALNHYSIPNQNSSYELNVLALWPTNVMSSYNLSKGNMKTTNPWGTKRMLTYGLTTNTTEFTSSMTSYSQLPAGTCMLGFGERCAAVDMNNSGRDYSGGADALFGYDDHVCLASSGAKINEGTESSWQHVIWRLADDVPAAASYGVCRTYWSTGGWSWTLESSADGENWTLRDDHVAECNVAATNVAVTTLAEAYALSEFPLCPESLKDSAGCRMWYNNGEPYHFKYGGTAAERLSGVKVSVASGATLDTSYIADEALSIVSLDVDCASGAGTITKFRPAANGTLALTGVDGKLPGRYVVPISLSEVVDAENFASWNVTLNGTRSPATTLAWANGVLVANTAHGTIVVFR